ncbi:MAG TPA: DUF5652 family protein [Patescibacteria group bacterium]|nr:DUF5652 family protein [Patescibacteria group bacterium]
MYPFSRSSMWIVVIVIWETVWKAIALWRAARKNQRNWFITLIAINSAGLLPIIYLLFFSKKPSHKVTD